MLVSQILVCFHAIRQFPGLTLNQLSKKIYEEYKQLEAVQFMVSDEGGSLDISHLEYLIKELNCVELKDRGYHYNPDIQPYSKNVIFNCCIKQQAEMEAAQTRAKLKEKVGD